MVDKHQLQHLDEWGICLEMEGRRVRRTLGLLCPGQRLSNRRNLQFKAVWKHQQVSHLQSGRIRNVKKDNRRPVIKEEDS